MTELDFFGPQASFHHVGVAVRSIDEVAPGLDRVADPTQRVVVGFLGLHGATVELIEPFQGGSPIDQSLAKGVKLVHLCYEVPDLQAALAACREHGFHALGRPAPAPAFDGRRIQWVFHRGYGLFELLERAPIPGDPGRDSRAEPPAP